jgi:hypothetical protein
MATKRVFGDRICGNCGGLCHEDSFRTATGPKGKRRRYFCSGVCAKRKLGPFWGLLTYPVDVISK